MTYAISVPTPFNEINELAENFAARVDEGRIMLPHYEAIPEGESVEFEITFGDGSPAIAGTGLCTSSFDNGEDRAPEHRFDVVLDDLQLNHMAQIYFERILMARASQPGAEPVTGQVEVPLAYEPIAGEATYAAAEPYSEEAEAIDSDEISAASAFASSEAAPSDAGWDEPSAHAPEPGRPAERVRLAAPVHAIYELPPPAAPGQLPSPHAGNGQVLTRRSLDGGWVPIPMERPEPRPSSGLFQYGRGALPQPNDPPRPQLDPSLRVAPAPRPGDGGYAEEAIDSEPELDVRDYGEDF
jgi:hypothetical protein